MKKAFFYFISLSFFVFIGCTDENNTNPAGQTPNVIDENEFFDGPNLLKNGGMEEWNLNTHYDILDEWFAHNNGNVRRNWEKVYEGYYSAKMNSLEKGSTAIIDQRISVTPGSRIRIRFKYYIEKWEENGARTYCYFRTCNIESTNIPNAELHEFYSNEEYCIIRGGGYGLKYLPHTLNTWLTFDETIIVPPTANYFVFGVNSYYGTTVYIDDCCVCELIPNTTKQHVFFCHI